MQSIDDCSLFIFHLKVHMQLEGRRGRIEIDQTKQPWIATKHARTKLFIGAIQKEAELLKKLNQKLISFVPQLIKSGKDWFSYERIEGDCFKKVYIGSSNEKKKNLAVQLIEAAYTLDIVGVLHGELDHPRTNVLVDSEDKVRIIDFDRGGVGDYSGKNLRHVAQRLYREGYISLKILKWLWKQTPGHIYEILHTSLFTVQYKMNFRKDRIAWLLMWFLLVGIDQFTKRLFYGQQWLAGTWLFNPVINTGIGRSIAVPLPLTISITVLICLGMIRTIRKYPTYRRVILFLLAWAIGNLIDRVVFHGVRDFIDFHVRPVLNIADTYLTIGILLLLYRTYTQSKE